MAYQFDQSGSKIARSTKGRGGGGASAEKTTQESEGTGSNQGALTDLGLAGGAVGPRGPVPVDTGNLVKDVRKRLSTSWRDFTVSTNDAVWVFEALRNQSMATLVDLLGRIDDDRIERFFAKLPESKKGTAAFGRIAVAVGPARITPYVNELLSRGAFDWIISDKDAEQAAWLLLALPRHRLLRVLNSMGPDQVDRLVSNLNDADLLAQLFAIRFNLDVGAMANDGDHVGMNWSVKGLRQMWHVVEDLPKSHVEYNANLDEIVRYDDVQSDSVGSSGMYSGSRDQIMIQYQDEGLAQKNTSGQLEKETLFDGNYFDQTIRHEIGHAVDDKIDGYNKLSKTGKGAKWNWEWDLVDVVRKTVRAHGEAISALGLDKQQELFEVIAEVMLNGDSRDVWNAIETSDVGMAMDGDTIDAILFDPAIIAIQRGMDEPWASDPLGGFAVNGRIYQRSYDKYWTSYEASARRRSVSSYQFRAPGEWFAEAYAAYFDPRFENGGGLGKRDPKAKKWFDTHVSSSTSSGPASDFEL